MRRGLLLLLAVALLSGLGVLAAFFAHHRASARERAEAAGRAPALATAPTLTAEDACWLVRDFIFSGHRGGLRPRVDCEGALEPVQNGLRLTGVLRAADFGAGRHRTTYCLSRGARWVVLGEGSELDECRALPARGGDPETAGQAVAEADRAAALRTIAAVREALEHTLDGLPACAALGLPPAAVGLADERRLQDPALEPLPRLIPHDARFSACLGPPPAGLPDTAGPFFRCRPRPEWTHVAVVHLDDFTPPRRLEGERFAGGSVAGALLLVALDPRALHCAVPFQGALPERVLTSRSTTLEEAFAALVEQTLRPALAEVLATP